MYWFSIKDKHPLGYVQKIILKLLIDKFFLKKHLTINYNLRRRCLSRLLSTAKEYC